MANGTIWMNPDCSVGKHPGCHGVAWNMHEDAATRCECDCHDKSGENND